MSFEQQQPNLWQDINSNLVFADLCNALYERELKKLATDTHLPQPLLQKRLSSLPHFIKRASTRIIEFTSPLDLDSHNASWMYRQSGLCPGPKQATADISKFYQSHATVGLVIPIYRQRQGIEHILLDNIDGLRDNRIHTNEHGWFEADGSCTDDPQLRLLKPTKIIMTGACSGHSWRNHKRHSSRSLSLREMLLATNINWRNFAKTVSHQ